METNNSNRPEYTTVKVWVPALPLMFSVEKEAGIDIPSYLLDWEKAATQTAVEFFGKENVEVYRNTLLVNGTIKDTHDFYMGVTQGLQIIKMAMGMMGGREKGAGFVDERGAVGGLN